MKFSDLVVLLPCTTLEDLPLQWEPDEAEGLLSAYSALWHPAFVASAGSMPRWSRAEEPPQGPEGALILVPSVSETRLPADWLTQAESTGLCVLRGLQHRSEMVSAALERLEGGDQGICPELARDFLTLGYAHLLTELVTRQIRYMSNLDEVRFGQEVVSAAQAAREGQEDVARDHLRAAFDRLAEARQYYYPAETYLLDLTVVAVTTLGPALRVTLESALAGTQLTNLLLGAGELERLAQQDPDTLLLLRTAWSEKKVGVVGGGKDESSLPLMPLEAVLENIQQGLEVLERLGGQRPRVFGRRRYGLTILLPQILAGLGVEGVFHGALDDGRFPTSHQSKIRWEGPDGTALDSLARIPFDATRSDTFLRIARTLGDTLDWDQTSMAILAHWPGQSSPWLEDLHRMNHYTHVAGRFTTVEDYLEQTHYAGQQKKYSADEYRSAYLRQEVARRAADPISRWVDYHRVRAGWERLRTMAFLVETLTGLPIAPNPLPELQEAIRTLGAQEGRFRPELWSESLPHRSALEQQLETATQQMGTHLSQTLCPVASVGEKAPQQAPVDAPDQAGAKGKEISATDGILMVNPASFTRRMWIASEGPARLATLEGVAMAGYQAAQLLVAAEVAGMGFVWLGLDRISTEDCPSQETVGSVSQDAAGARPSVAQGGATVREPSAPGADDLPTGSEAVSEASPSAQQPEAMPGELIYPRPKEASRLGRLLGKKPREVPPLAEEHLLRNEYFEARLDPSTGALRGVYTYGSRRPRCAQQLALRIPTGSGKGPGLEDSEQNYTIMAADRFRILSAGPLVGQLEVQGRLMTQRGECAARFTEIFRSRRGDPVLEIRILLEPELLPEADPWNSYYTCRFAWGDQSCEIFRSVNQLTCRTEATLLETPWFVDLRTEKERTTLLFGGLPYHRRIGVHKLDTLLVVSSETARRFRLGIGIDLKHPMCAAWDFLAPPVPIPLRSDEAGPPALKQGWFFRLNVRNVLATAWESLVEEGRVRGFRVRLVETEGRATMAELRALRPLAGACQVDFTGKHIRDLSVEGDKVQIPLHGYQYLEVEAHFARAAPGHNSGCHTLR